MYVIFNLNIFNISRKDLLLYTLYYLGSQKKNEIHRAENVEGENPESAKRIRSGQAEVVSMQKRYL